MCCKLLCGFLYIDHFSLKRAEATCMEIVTEMLWTEKNA